MKSLTHWVMAVALLVLAMTANAETVVDVATHGFNRFTFSKPFNQVVLPPHAPLASKPVAMAGNKTLLVSFDDVDKPLQMVVQLTGGQVVNFTLRPTADQPANWTQAGKLDTSNASHPQDQPLIDLFRTVLANPNKAPTGFHSRPIPDKGHIHGLVADYVAHYRNQNYQILAMRLRSRTRAHILPQDLYVRGVAAVYIDGDTVGPQTAPLAVVLKSRASIRGR